MPLLAGSYQRRQTWIAYQTAQAVASVVFGGQASHQSAPTAQATHKGNAGNGNHIRASNGTMYQIVSPFELLAEQP